MANKFLPGSFSKEFGWNSSDLQKLHAAIREGFSSSSHPTLRAHWRKNSGLNDPDRELIPLNFFLFSKRDGDEDYVLVDELVRTAVSTQHSRDFDLLALFALHLGISGNWHYKDPARVDWPNFFIRNYAWQNDSWARGAFDDHVLMDFVNKHVEATDGTKRKIKTNYHYILEISGALDGILNQPIELMPERWGEKACMLLWDRLTYDGSISKTPSASELVDACRFNETHKLLGCSLARAEKIISPAAAAYQSLGGVARF